MRWEEVMERLKSAARMLLAAVGHQAMWLVMLLAMLVSPACRNGGVFVISFLVALLLELCWQGGRFWRAAQHEIVWVVGLFFLWVWPDMVTGAVLAGWFLVSLISEIALCRPNREGVHMTTLDE